MKTQSPVLLALLLLIFLLLTVSTNVVADSDGVKFHYSPAEESLSGKIFERTFAGPPNYHSVRRGDLPEHVLLLVLAKPIYVSALAADQENETAKKVKEVQLVFVDGPQYQEVRHFVSRQLIVTGKMFSAQSGHHHTKVLMEVVGIRLAE